MTEIPNDMKRLLFEKNPKSCCWMHGILTYMGIAFMVIGIVSDVMNKTLGLESTNWFLMAIGSWMLGIFAWFRGYFSAKES